METYKKSERLCNFTYKELLFKKGKSFFSYPFRVHFLILEPNLEPLFFGDSPLIFEGNTEQTPLQREQNPGYPHRKLPANAYFPAPVKCLITAPKKNFKKATDRNRIKRIVKEAYRKNKSPLYTFLQEQEIYCLLALVYASKTLIPYHEVESKISVTLHKLQEAIVSSSRLSA